MKAKTLQIVWHEKEPVYSVDFHPSGILASGGADKSVKITEDEEGSPAVSHLSSFTGLNHSVNVVRFSPNEGRGPIWKMYGTLRGHNGDVQDLSWSPDASALVSGSIENLCILWDVESKRGQARFENHHHYVQGVAWDPLGHFIVSQSNDRTCKSNDRTCKVYGQRPPALGSAAARKAAGPPCSASLIKDFVMTGTLSKRAMATEVTGSVLAVPAGIFKADSCAPVLNTTYIFGRGDWSSPLMHLPSLSKPVVAVRFCPTLFTLKEDTPPGPLFKMNYRMIFAIATMDSVLVYDTQSLEPLLLVGGLHIAAITDLAWAPDGRCLAVSSHDGYCSLVTFEKGELGTPAPIDSLPPAVAACATKLAAQRFAERTAAAAALKAAKGAALALQKQQQHQEQAAGKPPSAQGGDTAAPGQAAPRRIQPISADSAGGGATPGQAAPRRIQPISADSAGGGATPGQATPRRIQPISADSAGGSATPGQAAPPRIQPVAANPGGDSATPGQAAPRRIQPTATDPGGDKTEPSQAAPCRIQPVAASSAGDNAEPSQATPRRIQPVAADFKPSSHAMQCEPANQANHASVNAGAAGVASSASQLQGSATGASCSSIPAGGPRRIQPMQVIAAQVPSTTSAPPSAVPPSTSAPPAAPPTAVPASASARPSATPPAQAPPRRIQPLAVQQLTPRHQAHAPGTVSQVARVQASAATTTPSTAPTTHTTTTTPSTAPTTHTTAPPEQASGSTAASPGTTTSDQQPHGAGLKPDASSVQAVTKAASRRITPLSVNQTLSAVANTSTPSAALDSAPVCEVPAVAPTPPPVTTTCSPAPSPAPVTAPTPKPGFSIAALAAQAGAVAAGAKHSKGMDVDGCDDTPAKRARTDA
eukprot:gene22059-29124_t